MKAQHALDLMVPKGVRPLEDYQVIGRRWKCGNTWSLTILIGRGLDFKTETKKVPTRFVLFTVQLSGCASGPAGKAAQGARSGNDMRGAWPEG